MYHKPMIRSIQAIIYQEGRDYVAQSLGVDVSSFGATEAEALGNLKEALELYFEDQPVQPFVTVSRPKVRTLHLSRA